MLPGITKPDERTRAWALLSRCGGIEESGMPQLAHETRWAARRILELLDEIAVERSARQALQQRAEQQQAILGKRLYDAIAKA